MSLREMLKHLQVIRDSRMQAVQDLPVMLLDPATCKMVRDGDAALAMAIRLLTPVEKARPHKPLDR